MPCRRQGTLTQGPAQGPKCKLNISSFLTLPHWLDCPICTRNTVSILFLFYKWWGDGTGSGWLIHMTVWVGWQGLGIISFFTCTFVFWCLIYCLFFNWVEHDSYCVCFFVYYLFSLSLVPWTKSYWGIEIVVSLM